MKMPLNDARIRAAKPGEKRYKLADGGGLYLVVEPNGSKLWRYKYRIDGRENVFSIGAYPAVSILAARREHLVGRERATSGEHPAKLKRKARAAQWFASANTFKALRKSGTRARPLPKVGLNLAVSAPSNWRQRNSPPFAICADITAKKVFRWTG